MKKKLFDNIPMIGQIGDPDLGDKLEEALSDTDMDMNRNRPYSGQPWTCGGERGKREIKGITFRDLRDCFIRGACLAMAHTNLPYYIEAEKGEKAQLNTDTLYALDWSKCDPLAVAQNMSCEVEKLMGIYPNVPPVS